MRGSFSSFSRFKGFCIAGCRGPAGRAPLYAENLFGIQRYSSLFPLREQKTTLRIARFPHRKSYADHSGDTRFSRCNITPPRRERQTLRTASGGQERSAASGATMAYYLAAGSVNALPIERMCSCSCGRMYARVRTRADVRIRTSSHGLLQARAKANIRPCTIAGIPSRIRANDHVFTRSRTASLPIEYSWKYNKILFAGTIFRELL